jgi:hypothetical protein
MQKLASLDADRYFRMRQRFPSSRRILPTALGNILRASEDLVFKKYKLEAVAIWPTLYPILSENSKAIVDSQRNQLDVTVRLFIVFIMCSIFSFAFYVAILYQVLQTNNFYYYINQNLDTIGMFSFLISLTALLMIMVTYSGWLIIPAAMVFLAWLTYKSVLSAAIEFGKGINSAFELNRFDLLKSLHFELPDNLENEKRVNYKLSQFFVIGNPYDLVYVHEGSSAAKKGAPFP